MLNYNHIVFLVALLFPVVTLAQITNVNYATNDLFQTTPYVELINQELKKNRIVNVVGDNDSGKEEIVSAFLSKNKNTYDLIWEIDLNKDVIDQLKLLLMAVNHGNIEIVDKAYIIQKMQHYLINSGKRWIVVFKNTTDLNLKDSFFSRFMLDNGNIIVVSNAPTFVKTPVFISNLDKRTVDRILTDSLPQRNKLEREILSELSEKNIIILKSIIEFLKINAFLKVEDYKNILLKNREELRNMDSSNLEKKYKSMKLYSSVLPAVKVTMDKMIEDNPETRNIMHHLVMFGNNDIPSNFFRQCLNYNEQDYLSLLANISEYGFININQREGEYYLAFNEMTEMLVLDRLTGEEKQNIKNNVMNKLSKIIPQNIDQSFSFLSKNQSLIAHLKKLVVTSNKAFHSNIGYQKLLLSLASYKAFIEKDVESLAEMLSEKYILEADIQDSFLKSYYHYLQAYLLEIKEGKFEEATKLLLSLVSSAKDNNLKFRAYNSLAQISLMDAKLELAITYHDQAKKLLDKDNLISDNLDDFYMTHARNLMDQGDYQAAEESVKQGRAYLNGLYNIKSVFVPINVLETHILNMLGKGQEALAIIKPLYDEIEDILKVEKTMYKASIYGLYAETLITLGQYEKAEELIGLSQNVILSISDDKESGSIGYLNDLLGDIYFKQNKYKEAIEHFRVTDRIYDKEFQSHKVDYIGKLYYKMAYCAYKLDSKDDFRKYFDKHLQNFGSSSERSKELIKLLKEI